MKNKYLSKLNAGEIICNLCIRSKLINPNIKALNKDKTTHKYIRKRKTHLGQCELSNYLISKMARATASLRLSSE